MSTARPAFADPSGPPPLERPVSPEHAVREALPGRSGRQLVLGVLLIAVLVCVGWFMRYLALVPYVPEGRAAWLPWAALLAAAVVSTLLVVVAHGRPSRIAIAVICGLALAVGVLELVTTAGLLERGIIPSAIGAIGMLLAVVGVVGDPRWAGGTGILLGIATLADAIVQAPAAGPTTVEGVGIALAAAVPAVLAGVAMTGFNRMVEVDFDHSIVQSTVGAGPTLPNARAGEELASLDYEAEQLLGGVAAGRIPLPLSVDEAARAARVGAALRIRLIEGRTDTWLKHAVAESELLAGSVVVDDPEGDAARLSPGARDALLLSLWLLVDERPRGAQVPIRVAVCADDDVAAGADRLVRIELTIAGGSRRRIDPSTWEALVAVGPPVTSLEDRQFRITISSRVDPDAPYRTTPPSRKAR